jgi:hypothetical protein
VSQIPHIKQAVAEVPGITDQEINIMGYIAPEEFSQLINKEE